MVSPRPHHSQLSQGLGILGDCSSIQGLLHAQPVLTEAEGKTSQELNAEQG